MIVEVSCFLPAPLAQICCGFARAFDVSGRTLCEMSYTRVSFLLEHEDGPTFCYLAGRSLTCRSFNGADVTLLKDHFDESKPGDWAELLTQMKAKLQWHSLWGVLDLKAGVALDRYRCLCRHQENIWIQRLAAGTPLDFCEKSCILDNYHFLSYANHSLFISSFQNNGVTILRGHTKAHITKIAANNDEILVGCDDGSVHAWLDWKRCFEVQNERCLCHQNADKNHCMGNPRHKILAQVHTTPIYFLAMLRSYFVSAATDGVWLWKRKSRSPWLHFDVQAVDTVLETSDGHVLLRHGSKVTLLNPHVDKGSTSLMTYKDVREIAQLSDGCIVVIRNNALCTVHE